MLFPKLDRGLNVQDPQPHQDLVAEILASDRCLGNHQRPLLEVFSDPRWAQVRSTSPLACWDRALTRNGIQPQRIADLGRGQMIVRIFTKIGRENGNDERKRHLCLWLAPSLYTVSDPATVDKVGDLFSIMEPLNRDFVALESRASEMDEAARQVGSHQLFTGKGVIRVEDESRNHLGSVTQGRWKWLATVYDEEDIIRALPGWVRQVEAEERTRGVPSHQLWLGICKVCELDTIVGCNPLVAPSCFLSSLCGSSEEGWGHRRPHEKIIYNFLCMPGVEITAIVTRLNRDTPWLALTRARTLPHPARERLKQVGTQVITWPKGTVAASSAGNWRKAQIRSAQIQEDWTLWANARTATETGHMRQALRRIKLSRAGDIPLEVDSPSFREAQLGPAGVGFTHAGTTIATDGAVKDDGRMGAAYVALGSRIPPRSFVVLGPPSSMRAELSAIDQAVADAPEQEELNILTDSLSSIIKLANMQRRDFPEWLHGHPEKVLLESVCKRINARAQARMMTRIIKVPAHRAHALNEAADAAACAAAEEADPESVTLSHADSNAVRFYLHDALTEWGACVRNHLIQTTAQQHAKRLQLTLARHVNESPVANNAAGPHRHRSKVSFAAQWLLRSGQGRNFLGAAMASMRNGARKRRLLQTIAGVFPCRALLYKWGKTPSPQCLLCNQEAETP